MANNDVLILLNEIKQNIALIENGDRRLSIFDKIKIDFYEMLELIKLFLISERDSYYGLFLMNLKFNADFSIDSIAGVRLNEFPPVLDANPLLICSFSLKEIIFILCHEIDHIVFNHPTEMVKANPNNDPETFYEFNLAADAAVNDRLEHEIEIEKHDFMAEPKGIITSSVLEAKYGWNYIEPMESYAYYFNLIRSQKFESDFPAYIEPHGNNNTNKNGKESIIEGISNSGKKANDDSVADNDYKSDDLYTDDVVTVNSCEKISDHDWQGGEDPEDVNANVRELVNNVTDMMNEESRGLMPAYFFSAVDQINAPPVLSWQSILKKYIGTISAGKRKTRTRLNRRQPERFDLSGRVDEKIVKIVVAIDTSCSITDEMINRIFNEIFAILAKRKHEITVIECDSTIQRVYKMSTPSDFDQQAMGRGGTSFIPVIEFINENRYFRDSLLIYFTDGYGDSIIPRPLTYRNLWVVFDNIKHLSVENPYGQVVQF